MGIIGTIVVGAIIGVLARILMRAIRTLVSSGP